MTAKEIVVSYADALGKGNIPTAFSFFSAEVQWHQPGNNQFSGLKKGADEIGGLPDVGEVAAAAGLSTVTVAVV